MMTIDYLRGSSYLNSIRATAKPKTNVHFQSNPFCIKLVTPLSPFEKTKHGHCQSNNYTELTEAGVICIHILITSFLVRSIIRSLLLPASIL